MARYAETTSVPSSRTQGEIKEALKKAGAGQIAIFEEATKSAVMFTLATGMYRLTVPMNLKAKNPEQEDRRIWRVLGLLIKAKLTAVAEGASTIEREFLADRVLFDGQTMSERVLPELAIAHKEGRMPTNLMLTGPQ
jgi:hypothetical protein